MDKSASEEELKELELFLQQFPRYKKMQQVTDALKSELKQPNATLKETEINNKLDELWVKIKKTGDRQNESLTEKVISFSYWKLIGIAAAVILVTLTGVLFYNNYQRLQNEAVNVAMLKVDVPYGKMVQIVLPDGTKVRLNSGSHFSYPTVFSNKKREVKLDGEGFFEVTHNAKKPFLVHTSLLTVRVLGTVFNVKAYHDDKNVETTLLKGKVQVELKDDPEKNIILAPHEKLTVPNSQVPAAAQSSGKDVAKMKYELATLPDVSNETYQENAWLDNKIVFTNNDFENVARQMERKYNVRIVFEDEGLKREEISGVLKDESLDSALQILKQIISFKSKVNGNTVYLAHKFK